ncbi:MAG TPA: SigB/SigF/SigG family RNA polymerase sigma factor [bacterium]|jgi:RNA polymerase sporulation-specific sigma factor|nr:SigB/SigF/SigG family RNA polymerase sigma factor [bacterium]
MTDHFLRLELPQWKPENDKTMELLARTREGDLNAREKVINDNLRLVIKIARRFAGRGYEIEDLFQIGALGLMKAVDKFDPSHRVQFSTYAVPMIIGEIRRFLRDDSPIKVSRALKETAFRSRRAKQLLAQQLGRDPSVSEIAAEISVSTEELVSALEATQTLTSLSEPIYGDETTNLELQDRLPEDKTDWFGHILLSQVLEKLTPREQFIIRQRFYADKTQTQVAKKMALSQVQVSRLEKQILLKIRKLLESG